jgi:hypothetical protein
VLAVAGEEIVGFPVERMAHVHAVVAVGKDATLPPHEKSHERPIAVADSEFPTARVVEFVESTDSVRVIRHAHDDTRLAVERRIA